MRLRCWLFGHDMHAGLMGDPWNFQGEVTTVNRCRRCGRVNRRRFAVEDFWIWLMFG